jgi:hypothetical protein
MMSLKQAATLLENVAGVTDINITEDGWLHTHLPNRIDPARPYTLMVHPILEALLVRLRVEEIATVRSDSQVCSTLVRLNAGLSYGCVAVDGDGTVLYQIHHACRDDDEGDPAPEVFLRLVDETRKAVHIIASRVILVKLVESGVPDHVAKKVYEMLGGGEGNEETL